MNRVKEICIIIGTIALMLVIGANVQAQPVTKLTLFEREQVTTADYPLTFGHVFKDGDVSSFVRVIYNGVPLPTQCDVKTTYDSGFVRFAIISAVLPEVVSESTNSIVLDTTATTASSGYMEEAALLATNKDRS